MSLVYAPKGAAREYAALACNPFEGECPHRCRYDGEKCYANRLWARFHPDCPSLPLRPKRDLLERLEAEAAKLAGDPRPVHLTFMADPYPQGRPDLWSVTREVLTILRAHDLHWQVLTKGGLQATNDFDLYRPGDWFGVTLTCGDPELQGRWEPGAAPAGKRSLAVGWAHKAGLSTWVSCEPVVEPAEILRCIREAATVDLWRIGGWSNQPREVVIDWPRFGHDLAEALEATGARYYVKHSLRPHMPEGFPPERGAR